MTSNPDRDDAENWLGAEFGDMHLSDTVKGFLIAGWDEDLWTLEEDTPSEDGTTIFTKELKALWTAVLKDSAAVQKKPIGESHTIRFCRWLEAQCLVATEDEIKYVASKNEKEDLDAQGMSSHLELRMFELGKHLGRTVTAAEVAGGEYRAPPQAMAGGKTAAKFKMRTFQDVLAEARAGQNLAPIQSHISRYTGQLSDSGGHMETVFATRLLRVWQKAQDNLKHVTPIITYMEEMSRVYVGRGFPLLYDTEIGQAASITTAGGGFSQPAPAGPAAKGPDTSGDKQMAILTALEEMANQNKALASRVQGLADKVNNLQGNANGTRKCFRCGSTEHAVADCDKPKDFKKDP